MGGKVKSTMGKKLKNIASTQQYLPILDVQDDIRSGFSPPDLMPASPS